MNWGEVKIYILTAYKSIDNILYWFWGEMSKNHKLTDYRKEVGPGLKEPFSPCLCNAGHFLAENNIFFSELSVWCDMICELEQKGWTHMLFFFFKW